MPDPDAVIYCHLGPLAVNATLLSSWVTIVLLTAGSWLLTRHLSGGGPPSRRQQLAELVLLAMREQCNQIGGGAIRSLRFFPLVATLFLYISASSVLSVVPGLHPATMSLSTTAALAFTVFVAVPVIGMQDQGVRGYLRHYLSPTFFMLPFHVLGEVTRTIALAIRLFGNVMSGSVLVGILLSIAPFFLPVLAQLMELLFGQIQAYIFAVLATVYLASAQREGES